MLRQYQELKQQHPGTLLFFRLGDFYELFCDDVVTGSRELQITLTARQKDSGNPIPMCGVPHHSAAGYIARLVRKGYRVAICEQTEDATKTKKLVRREVVRIVTPGTPIDPQLLEARESVYLAAVCSAGETIGAAFLDISTGEFRVTQETGRDSWVRIRADLESYAPRELLFPASLGALIRTGLSGRATTAPLPLQNDGTDAPEISPNEYGFDATLTALDDWQWQRDDCQTLLVNHFKVRTLDGYGLARLLRAQGRALPLVALTARADAASERAALEAGMDAFLRKPVTGAMLAAALDGALRTRAQPREAVPYPMPEPTDPAATCS